VEERNGHKSTPFVAEHNWRCSVITQQSRTRTSKVENEYHVSRAKPTPPLRWRG